MESDFVLNWILICCKLSFGFGRGFKLNNGLGLKSNEKENGRIGIYFFISFHFFLLLPNFISTIWYLLLLNLTSLDILSLVLPGFRSNIRFSIGVNVSKSLQGIGSHVMIDVLHTLNSLGSFTDNFQF